MSVDRDHPPYKVAGAILLSIVVVAGILLFLQFRGDFTKKAELTLMSPRAGLVVEPGAKVTYTASRSAGCRASPRPDRTTRRWPG